MTGEQVLELVVHGPAQQQGSVKTFVPEKGGRPLRRPNGSIVVNVTTDNRELKAWRKRVAEQATAALRARFGGADASYVFPLAGVGFTVSEVAYFRRPEGHYGTGRNFGVVKDRSPARPITQAGGQSDMAPDVDKLLRACLDALTGVVWADDSQVTDVIGRKRYGVPDEHGEGTLAVVQVWLNAQQTAGELPLEERVRYVRPRPGETPAMDDAPQLALPSGA